MASIPQLISQLRFGLEQLSVRNGQHEFEHLCRAYARKRICSNLLPATGPVSAGGDQGRDFETFRSYLENLTDIDSAFAGRISEGPIAFACTLQKKDLPSKIKADVKSILAGGNQVVGITYFCVADLDVSKRHKLQEWCSVPLDIHDGAAISENLAEPDCFWIASEYLDIPSEIFPTTSELQQEEYQNLKEHWSHLETPSTYSEFEEVKRMVRACTFNDAKLQELPFWMGRMSLFTVPTAPGELTTRARYEIAVAQLRGIGFLTGHEPVVLDFFEEVDLNSLSRLEDATVLLSYCMTATAVGEAEFEMATLRRFQETLIEFVEGELENETFVSRRATLFQLRASLSIHSATDTGIEMNEASQMPWLVKLAEIVEHAHLFPLERFADCLTLACHVAGDHPSYDKVAAKVDEALAKRRGGFAAAEKCCDRAIAHYERGRTKKAIAEIQKAQIDWFAEETLTYSLKTLLLLSCWHREIGLVFAAKYYGLATAYIALHQDNFDAIQESWRGLAAAANCDYLLGAFAGFLDLTKKASSLHSQFAKNPGQIEQHDELEQLLIHVALAVCTAERLAPKHHCFIQERAEGLNIGPVLDGVIDEVREVLAGTDNSKLEEDIASQLFGSPANDYGCRRVVAWQSLGAEWVIEWENVYLTNVLAEQFVAGLQIVQTTLSDQAICLPKARIRVVFEHGQVAEPTLCPLASDEGEFSWSIVWPSLVDHLEPDKVLFAIVGSAVDLLAASSFLDNDRVVEMLDLLMTNGLPSRAIIGQPYEVVLREFIDEKLFNEGRAVLVDPGDAPSIPKNLEHPELRGFTGSGPGYTAKKAADLIETRYIKIPNHIPFTIERLNSSSEFRSSVKLLKSERWKEWHILSAVFTATLNYRFAEKHGQLGTPEQMRQHMTDFMAAPETEKESVIPTTIFDRERLDFHRKANLNPVLRAWGFAIHHPAFTASIIEQFLDDHYGYWSDDVPHETIFS